MQKKIDQHVFQGMQRDMSISKQKPEYLWDAHNIRLTTRHGETLLSMTNERGTKKYENIHFSGVVLGYCVIGNYLTVFTTDQGNTTNPDYIYLITKSDNSLEQQPTILYNGNLHFDVEHPIETLGVYENETIQKVYWTDGINQPRVINILKNDTSHYVSTSFDFIPTLTLEDSIYVQKVADSSGLFPAGVIQYAVTYYNKYSQESNVSVISPLIPTSYTQRAGGPEETIGNAFKVTIKNPDTNFEYLRLYSIFRSSKDTTPVCKRVADIKLSYSMENIVQDSIQLPNGITKSSFEYIQIKNGNDQYTAYVSTDYGQTFQSINSFERESRQLNSNESEFIAINGILYRNGHYWHFTKSQYPGLVIKAYMRNSDDSDWNNIYSYFMWGDSPQDSKEIYIAEETISDNYGDMYNSGRLGVPQQGIDPIDNLTDVFSYRFSVDGPQGWTREDLNSEVRVHAVSREENLEFTIGLWSEANLDLIDGIDVQLNTQDSMFTLLDASGQRMPANHMFITKETLTGSSPTSKRTFKVRFNGSTLSALNYQREFNAYLDLTTEAHAEGINPASGSISLDKKTISFFITDPAHNDDPVIPETSSFGVYTSIMSKFRSQKFIVSNKNYQKVTVKYSKVTITDNGTIGNDIDYNEILFVGGEEITAQTLTQKDGTMFLGGIAIKRPQIDGIYDENGDALNTPENASSLLYKIKTETSINKSQRFCWYPLTMNDLYKWGNSLLAKVYRNGTKTEESTNIAGFKYGEHYRLGLQFQYKTGKWSQPVFIKDETSDRYEPSYAVYDGYCRQNVPSFNALLGKDVGDMLKDRGYYRVRSVVCFPTMSDQLITCQGVLNSTVYCIGSRANHSPDSQSSWFFRPIINKANGYNSQKNQYISQGEYVQYKHGYTIDGFNKRSGEIQCSLIPSDQRYGPYEPVLYADFLRTSNKTKSGKWPQGKVGNGYNSKHMESLADYTDLFVVDANIITMHSPEFEFNDSFASMDLTDLKCRCIGESIIGGVLGDISIITSTPTISGNSGGFHHRTTRSFNSRRLCSGLFYRDGYVWHDSKEGYMQFQGKAFVLQNIDVQTDDETGQTSQTEEKEKALIYTDCVGELGFMVYPWHRSGSLNNDCARSDGSTRSAMLQHKVISNLMFSNGIHRRSTSEYQDLLSMTEDTIGTEMKLFNSDQVNLVKINGLNYFGNIDHVISPILPYPICFGWKQGNGPASFNNYSESDNFSNICSDISNLAWTTNLRGISKCDNYTNELRESSDPVIMKYKSTPHVVINLGTHEEEQEVYVEGETEDSGTYETQIVTVKNTIDTDPQNPPYDYLYLAEIYRDPKDSDFGGRTQDAIQSNLWYPAGPAVKIGFNADGGTVTAGGEELNGRTEVPFWYGDTYYQRYDCLKTYPFTDEDPNSIIEIGSFMVETKINLDGRYDKNRADITNFMLNPTVFNKINPVYSQMDNFFNYRILDDDYYALSKYPTMVTWTGYKNNAAEVDNWTNITLASTLEMDGTKGKVNAVRVNSDQLYCFQDDAIGQILFNSRVQISPSDGVPIEISNNYKVDGNRYISTSIGCKNKWSIAEGIDGLYFIDDNTKALYLLGGQAQLKPISTPLNMSYWFMTKDFETPWIQSYRNMHNIIIGQKGARCYYDKANADLYICTPEETLCYSEKLGQFISFFDYHNVIGMFNIDSDYYALNYPDSSQGTSQIYLWGMFKGKYNTFFDKIYQTDFTFISNENPLNDKIFTNIDMRGDFRYWPDNNPQDDFNSPNHAVADRNMFNTIRVWNEYQDTGEINMQFIDDTHSNMKKKFRIWRMDIPRDKDHVRQRIRNTWSKVKFTMNKPQTLSDKIYDMEIHDMGVVYFV